MPANERVYMSSPACWSRRTIACASAAILAIATASGAAVAASTTVIAAPAPFWGFVPGTDGALWGLQYDRDGPAVVRVDRTGPLTRTPPPGGLPFNGWRPFTGPDGAVSLFVRLPSQTPALMRLQPGSGAVGSIAELPLAAAGASGLTVAPDGAVWFARSCDDLLGRIAPGSGRISYMRLPRLGCGQHRAARRELGAALAFDTRGALWLVNLCMGRIDRMSLRGRVREWRTRLISCPSQDSFDLPVATPATIELDPDGGISYASRAVGGGSGRVHDGRRERSCLRSSTLPR
jgi:streptogramin lyase